jgi:hypothetical protein
MNTGIATAIFLVSVVLTLTLYYIKFIRKVDPIEFVENNSLIITGLLTGFVFIGTLTVGFNIIFLLLAFFLLFFLLFINR